MRFNQPPPRPMNPAAPRQFGAFGARPAQLQARAAAPMMNRQAPPPQMAPRPMAPRAPAPQQGNPMMGARMGAAMMSDERSKKRIAELEDLNDTYAALLDTPAATANVRPQAPPTADLDRSNARALGEAGSYSYEYKDPSAPGAARGRQAGPMAQELEGIPGVVQPGPDGLKRVDTGRLALATASATGDQERRLQDLEQKASPVGGYGAQRRRRIADTRAALDALHSDYDALSDDEISQGLAAGETRALDAIRGARSQGAMTDEERRIAQGLMAGEQRALSNIRGR
jgi:hypothetical protein